ERGHLGARLREAEDVVDEEKDVLALVLTEVLGDREPGEPDAQARARGLVHLAEDHRYLIDDLEVLHLADELCPLAAALAHAAEDGHARVLDPDVPDELVDHDRLPDTRAAEDRGF